MLGFQLVCKHPSLDFASNDLEKEGFEMGRQRTVKETTGQLEIFFARIWVKEEMKYTVALAFCPLEGESGDIQGADQVTSQWPAMYQRKPDRPD